MHILYITTNKNRTGSGYLRQPIYTVQARTQAVQVGSGRAGHVRSLTVSVINVI